MSDGMHFYDIKIDIFHFFFLTDATAGSVLLSSAVFSLRIAGNARVGNKDGVDGE